MNANAARLVEIDGDYRMGTLDNFAGCVLGVSEWVLIDQAMIDDFAACTGDRQWIHIDVVRASTESPLGTTIAHGFLVLSLAARFIFELGIVPKDARQAVNYGTERVRFLTPVRSGARIRDQVTLIGTEAKGDGRVLIRTEHRMEIEGEAKPAMIAEFLVLLDGHPDAKR